MKNEDIGEILGYVAGGIILISNSIQITNMIRTKNVVGISLIFLILCNIVSILFIAAGYLGNIMYIFIMNMLFLLQQLLMVILHVHYSKKKYPTAHALIFQDLDNSL